MILSGHNRAAIGRLFGLSYHSLYLHAHNHLTRQLVTHMESVQLKSSVDLLATIDDILKKSQVIFDRNYEKGRDIVALKALDGTRATIQLLAQISAQLHQAKQLELDREAQEAEEVEKKDSAFKAQFAILTTEELCVLERLHNKLRHQNKDQIIVDGRVTPHWLNPDKYEQ